MAGFVVLVACSGQDSLATPAGQQAPVEVAPAPPSAIPDSDLQAREGVPTQTPTPSILPDTPEPAHEGGDFDVTEFADVSPSVPSVILNGVTYPYEPAGGLERDQIIPVFAPIFLTALEAHFNPDELVMGVSINEDYRAYPVGMLAAREIVNDVVGGVPILVTWCSICFTGLVHDRRVDGETFRFGNEGTLFMQGLVLYDSQTYSIWSQPWGTAIAGPLKRTSLTLIPYELVPYSTWVERHPDTKILIDELRPQYYPPQFAKDDFVIGVAIKEAATGFYFGPALQQGIVNEMVGDDPIVLVVDPDSLDIDVFLRNPVPRDGGGQRAAAALTFMREKDGSITDAESGSQWDLERGISIDGPMRGTILRRIPFISSFDWAWLEFHPDAELWDGLRGFGR